MVNNQMDLKDYFVEWMQSEGSVQQFELLGQEEIDASLSLRQSQQRRDTLEVDYQADAFEASFAQTPLIDPY